MAQYDERFRLAVENAVVGFLIEDPHTGVILEANEAACSMLHRAESELVGRTWVEVTYPDDRERGMSEMARMMGGETDVIVTRKRYVTPDGAMVWANATITTVRDDHGHQRYNIVQLRDASLETALSDLVGLVADLPDGDVICGALLRAMSRRVGTSVVAVYLECDVKEALVLMGSAGWTAGQVSNFAEIPMGLNVPVSMASNSSEPVFMKIRHVPEVTPIACSWFESHPLRDMGEVAAFPIRSQGSTVGVLYMEASRPFDRSWQGVTSVEAVTNSLAPWLIIQRERSERPCANQRRRSPLGVSDRQKTIVRLVGEGLTNRAIADELGYSEATVRADLSHLSRMLGAHGRWDVVTKAVRAGL